MKPKQASRREFLKKTTAVGAVAALTPKSAERSDPTPSETSEVTDHSDMPRRAVIWELPSHILNILWDDIYPRVMPFIWDDNSLYDTLTQNGKDFHLGNDLIRNYLTMLASSPPSADFSEAFSIRLSLLADYFDQANTNQVPVSILPGIAYDFVLSNEGLELGLPPAPGRRDVYLKYTFRQVGKAPMLLPATAKALYLQQKGSPWNRPNEEARAIAIAAFSALSNETSGIPSNLQLGESKVYQIAEKIFTARSSEFEISGKDLGELLFKLFRIPRETSILKPNTLWLGMPCYTFLTGTYRTWQMTGAVYSAMMRELPRIFAQIWYNDDVNGAPLLPNHPGTNPYKEQYTSNSKVSGLFKDRIESWIPDQLSFRTTGHTHLEVVFEQTDTDVNGTMYLPPIPTQRPDLNAMIGEWKAGFSVNPVFTDCARTFL